MQKEKEFCREMRILRTCNSLRRNFESISFVIYKDFLSLYSRENAQKKNNLHDGPHARSL